MKVRCDGNYAELLVHLLKLNIRIITSLKGQSMITKNEGRFKLVIQINFTIEPDITTCTDTLRYTFFISFLVSSVMRRLPIS